MIPPARVVLIDIADSHTHIDEAERELAELQSLVKTYGGIDVVRIIQHRKRPDKSTFIGSGKMVEVTEIVMRERINIVIINAVVNPSIIFNITQILWSVNPNIQVWDRVDLILNIFDKHAQSAEAKLQIEIARMQHMGPRMYGLGGTYFSRQAGGIGTRGLGETNIELMKRHWRDQIKKKRDQLEKLTQHHSRQLARRKELGLKTVSLIGYTNAGKTSLFNLLSGKKNVVRDALFVTLDSAVGELILDGNKKVIISDTIGFIRNLPSSLIESFKSTLMESINADLILHVVDLSDPKMKEKIEVVEKVVLDLRIDPYKQMFVFNKVDMMTDKDVDYFKKIKNQYLDFQPQFISVKEKEGIDKLKQSIGTSIEVLK